MNEPDGRCTLGDDLFAGPVAQGEKETVSIGVLGITPNRRKAALVRKLDNIGTLQATDFRLNVLFNRSGEDRYLQWSTTPESLSREQLVQLDGPGAGRRVVLCRRIGLSLDKAERQRRLLCQERRSSHQSENKRA